MDNKMSKKKKKNLTYFIDQTWIEIDGYCFIMSNMINMNILCKYNYIINIIIIIINILFQHFNNNDYNSY